MQKMYAKRRGSTKQASLMNWPDTGAKPGQIQEVGPKPKNKVKNLYNKQITQ